MSVGLSNVEVMVPAIAAVAVAAVPSLLNHLYLKRNLGKKNGNGNVVQMSEALLEAFKQHTELDDIRFKELAEHIDASADSVKENTVAQAQGIVDSQEKPHTVVDVIHHDGEPLP